MPSVFQDLAKFHGFGREREVGADGALGAARAVFAVGDGGHGENGGVVSCRLPVVGRRLRGFGRWREGDLGRGVEVEVVGKAELGGDVNGVAWSEWKTGAGHLSALSRLREATRREELQ